MDFLASPDCFPLWRVAPSSLRIAARRDDAGPRPYLVRGAAWCDRSRPVSDRHCHGRGLSESRRLGRVLILWRRQVAWSSAHRAPPSWLGVARKSEPSPDHSRITHFPAPDGSRGSPEDTSLVDFRSEVVQFLIAIAMVAGYRKAGVWGEF